MKKEYLKIVAGIAFIILFIIIIMKKAMGMGLNNPFNLIYTENNKWQGQLTPTNRFAKFDTITNGIRAGLINLYNGYFAEKLTLRQIVAKYAPASDNNNEESYLNFLIQRTGLIPEQYVPKDKMLEVASAIMRIEQGQEIMGVTELKSLCIDNNLYWFT